MSEYSHISPSAEEDSGVFAEVTAEDLRSALHTASQTKRFPFIVELERGRVARHRRRFAGKARR